MMNVSGADGIFVSTSQNSCILKKCFVCLRRSLPQCSAPLCYARRALLLCQNTALYRQFELYCSDLDTACGFRRPRPLNFLIWIADRTINVNKSSRALIAGRGFGSNTFGQFMIN